ncbi:MAG: 50S ribosomal protein L21 [Proteobacteria bacterium]|nr:50S ribosomal protein L21 [Pseudomonadota bacterium]
MYAVIATGGKQYRVIKGETLRVEKLVGEEGEKIELDGVLMVVDGDKVEIGTPTLAKGTVSARIKSHGRGKKIEIIKFRRRKYSKTQAGHRQSYTEIEVTDIKSIGGSRVKAETTVKTEPKAKVEPKVKVAPKAKEAAKAKPEAKAKVETKAKAAPKAKPKTKAKPATKAKNKDSKDGA